MKTKVNKPQLRKTPADHGGRDLPVPPDEFCGGGDGIGRLGHHGSIAQTVFTSLNAGRPIDRCFSNADNAIQITTVDQSGVGSWHVLPPRSDVPVD